MGNTLLSLSARAQEQTFSGGFFRDGPRPINEINAHIAVASDYMGAGELRNPLLRGSYFFVSAYTYNKIRCIGVGIDRVAGRLGGGDPPGDSSLEALARLCAMRN